MNDTLKAAGRIGAELGAAKAEVERLSHKLERARDHLTHARHDVEIRANAGNDAARLVLKGIDQWLSDYDQSPDDTFTAVDMATAAAQGFRDGQAAMEPATAQDELPAGGVTIEKDIFGTVHIKMGDFDYIQIQYQYPYTDNASQNVLAKRIAELLTRPAQTEQQPVAVVPQGLPELLESVRLSDEEAKPHCPGATYWNNAVVACQVAIRDALYTAPIAQTAPQPEQSGLVEALKAMLETYGPPAAVADKCTYPVDHPITKARAALSAQRGEG